MNERPDAATSDRGAHESFKSLFSSNSFPGVGTLALPLSQDECVLKRVCDVPASPNTPAVRLSLAEVDEV